MHRIDSSALQYNDIATRKEREALDAMLVALQRMSCAFSALLANIDKQCDPHGDWATQSRLIEAIGRGKLANMEKDFMLAYGHLCIPDSHKNSSEELLMFMRDAIAIIGNDGNQVYPLHP